MLAYAQSKEYMSFLVSLSNYLNNNLLSSMIIFIVLIGFFLWFHVYMVTEGNNDIRRWLWHNDRSVFTMVVMVIPVYAICIFFWTLHLIFFMIAVNTLIELLRGNK